MKCLALMLVALLLGGCRSSTPSTPLSLSQPLGDATETAPSFPLETLPKTPLPTPKAPQQMASEQDAGTTPPVESVLSELEGRALLAQLFRQAGFRILYDVTANVAAPGARDSLRLDGFDPIRQVGYEYISAGERERVMNKVGVTENIFVIGPTGDDELLRQARIFLERHKRPASQ